MDSSSTTTEHFHGTGIEKKNRKKKQSSISTISSATSAARSIASVFSTNVPGDITEYELHHYPHTGRSSLQTDAATLHIPGAGGRTGATTPVNRDSSDSDSTLTVSSVASHEEGSPQEQQQEEQEGEGEEEEEEESWLKAFWGDHISVVVPIKYARDHLALERTYLSYHRTAMVFGMLSVITAQLTVINHAPNPNPTFGFRMVGKPLSVILACCALIISTVGVLRWWRLQNGLLRGVAISGGKELIIVGGIVGAIIAGTLGIVMALDISKEY